MKIIINLNLSTNGDDCKSSSILIPDAAQTLRFIISGSQTGVHAPLGVREIILDVVLFLYATGWLKMKLFT